MGVKVFISGQGGDEEVGNLKFVEKKVSNFFLGVKSSRERLQDHPQIIFKIYPSVNLIQTRDKENLILGRLAELSVTFVKVPVLIFLQLTWSSRM